MSDRTSGTALAWKVERACFNAFPSLKQAIVQGWLLRFSKGVSRRANSANPLDPDCAATDKIIGQIEDIYRGQGQPTIFRVPSLLALEEPLVTRGYHREGETCVLYSAIDAVAAAPDEGVELTLIPSAEWLGAMALFQQHGEAQRGVYRRIVEAIAVPAVFAGLRLDGRLAALAYGAVSDGLLVYESVITDPARRRQGLAARVVAVIAAWGRQRGANGVCLQLETANAPARALYHRLGISAELYRYHYRREPGPAVS